MVKGSGGSVCQEDISKHALKHLYALLVALNLPISTRHNAMHGISEIAAMLTYMCVNKVAFYTAARELRKKAKNTSDMPTSQWALGKLGSPTMEKMEKECKKMLAGMVRAAILSGMLAKYCMIAIDGHARPFTGNKDAAGDNVTGGKPKGGTSYFVHMITAKVVSETFAPTVAIERMLKNRSLDSCLESIFSSVSRLRLRPRLYLLDRGFFGIQCMETMEKCGVLFLMPARKTGGIKDAIEEFKRGVRKEISKYTIKSANGQFTFNLVIKKRLHEQKGERKWVYLVFATNVPRHRIDALLADVPKTYKKRWGIENGYKAIKQTWPPTCSPNFGVHLLLFYLAAIDCNLWYLGNATAREQAVKAGVSRKQAAKTRVVLRTFMFMIMDVAEKILAMNGVGVWRYLDGGG